MCVYVYVRQVESLLVAFWSQNFGDFQEVFLREDIINHITSKDRLIYSVRRILPPSCAQRASGARRSCPTD
jgi:hypothetical protein